VRFLKLLGGWAAAVFMLPLAGITAAGYPLSRYLEFPPHSVYVRHEPFSPPVFMALGGFIALAVFLLFSTVSAARVPFRFRAEPRLLLFALALLISWVIAWTRFAALAALQPHSFVLLWVSYIGLLRAVIRSEGGATLPMSDIFRLSIGSAAYWWLFEWLNRFVQNWVYHEVDTFSPVEYFFFATMSFATVLPAVWVTAELIRLNWFFETKSNLLNDLVGFIKTRPALILGALSLLLVGIFPNELFPLLWLAPLMLLSRLAGATSKVLAAPIPYALAGLWCGFLWELWNYKSFAGWEYLIPYVDRGRIFYMPLLGYAGYLPFGVLCGLVGELLLGVHPAAARGSSEPVT